MREWENFTYIPNTPWVASKNEEYFIKNCFLSYPFPRRLLTQSPNICERNRMIFLTPGDLNLESGLQQDTKERVVYASQADELLGLRIVGNRQAACTCSVRRKKMWYLRRKSNQELASQIPMHLLPRAGASVILDLPSPGCQGGQCWVRQPLLGGGSPVYF